MARINAFLAVYGVAALSCSLACMIHKTTTHPAIAALERPAYRANNVTYLNPEWVMSPRTDEFIRAKIDQMKDLKIEYQMIDVGFFDRPAGTQLFDDEKGNPVDGSMDPASYAELEHWVRVSRATDPKMMLIASINGSTDLHLRGMTYEHWDGKTHMPSVDKATMHDHIAAFAKTVVEAFHLDGINLDFEPLKAGSASADYRELMKKIRTAIGPSKHLSFCGAISSSRCPDDEVRQFGAVADMIVVMDYDMGAKDAAEYRLAVQEGVIRISKALPPTCQLVPLGPGKYDYSDCHLDHENALNHSLALNEAIREGARIAGSGQWWFQGVCDDPQEAQWFKEHWLNGKP